MIKTSVERIPLLGPGLVSARRAVRHAQFRVSTNYWERRYRKGGNSGAGSYGEVAKYKAAVLNGLVKELGVTTILEFGCGDGAQLALATYPRYVGLDVSRTAVQICLSLFSSDNSKSFLFYDPECFLNHGALQAEMVLSLDVLLHLVEDEVLARYLRDLDRASSKYLVFYTEDASITSSSSHVRYRKLSEWAHMLPDWQLTRRITNPLKGPDTIADCFLFERTLRSAEAAS